MSELPTSTTATVIVDTLLSTCDKWGIIITDEEYMEYIEYRLGIIITDNSKEK